MNDFPGFNFKLIKKLEFIVIMPFYAAWMCRCRVFQEIGFHDLSDDSLKRKFYEFKTFKCNRG